MLSMNGRNILCDTSNAETTRLRKPKFKKEVLNQLVFKREVLIEVMCRLSKERLREINKLEDEKKSVFIKRSSKSERRY